MQRPVNLPGKRAKTSNVGSGNVTQSSNVLSTQLYCDESVKFFYDELSRGIAKFNTGEIKCKDGVVKYDVAIIENCGYFPERTYHKVDVVEWLVECTKNDRLMIHELTLEQIERAADFAKESALIWASSFMREILWQIACNKTYYISILYSCSDSAIVNKAWQTCCDVYTSYNPSIIDAKLSFVKIIKIMTENLTRELSKMSDSDRSKYTRINPIMIQTIARGIYIQYITMYANK